MTTFARVRRRAAEAQGHRYYYCGLPMWEGEPATFAKDHGLSDPQARLLQATAEHLVPRSEGGGSGDNIVAACASCNRRRHSRKMRLSAESYRHLVAKRMSSGRWYDSGIRGHFDLA